MCSISTQNTLIPVEEAGKKFTLVNNNNVVVTLTSVDGCAITLGPRCDFLYSVSGKEIYVELKGSDIRHAADQISATIPQLSKVAIAKRLAAIVTSRVPREDSSTQRAKFLLRSKVQQVIIKNLRLEVAA